PCLAGVCQSDRRRTDGGSSDCKGAVARDRRRQEIPDIATLVGSANKGGGVRATAASALGREAWARRLPLLPAFIYVFLVTQIPFVLTIYYSFFSWNLLKPGSFHFAGLENYGSIFTNESIRIAVWNTVLLTISVIGISGLLGLAVAMILNSEVFAKGMMRTLMMGPFLILATSRALIWTITLFYALFVVQTFDSIFMLTVGGPGEDTTNIPFLLYLVAFQGFSIGEASAIGVVAVIITTIVATLALRTLFSIFQIEARR